MAPIKISKQKTYLNVITQFPLCTEWTEEL